MRNEIIMANGSVQSMATVPDDIKELYKTVWEVSQKTILQMAADRGAFIDQSQVDSSKNKTSPLFYVFKLAFFLQSLNIHVAEPNYGKLTSMHFYGWKLGLKTGMYYLRTKAAAAAIQFTVDKTKAAAASKAGEDGDKAGETSAAEGAKEGEAQGLQNMAAMVCSLQNKDDCLMCGS